MGPWWVETSSVYLGNALIQHPLTEKEFAQLLDLCKAWGPLLIKSLLEWDQGASPPLRMSVKCILAALPWLDLDTLRSACHHQSQIQ
jgi:hypothetical protein